MVGGMEGCGRDTLGAEEDPPGRRHSCVISCRTLCGGETGCGPQPWEEGVGHVQKGTHNTVKDLWGQELSGNRKAGGKR